MRTINLTAPDFAALETPKLNTWELTLKTITPMFGGSAKTREVDSTNPVRPSSVRGHLRFWWRATAGARFSSAEELFEAEEKLWGSATVPGLVSLRVETISGGTRKNYSDFVTGFGDARGYALFPFDKNPRKDILAATCLTHIEFSISITFPNTKRSEIENAVAAWVTFGGVGARTRRGCGSLETSTDLSLPVVKRQHQNLLTLVSDQYFIGQTQQDPIRAWKEAVELYRDFRQQPGFARGAIDSATKRPGRSRYPEPDTIRRLSPRLKWTHQATHPVTGYPRADLGLPIIFHFINEGSDHELKGIKDQQTRFASPVITKVIKTSNGYVPAIIILNAPHVWENGELSINREEVARAKIELSKAERQQVPPMNGLPIREALVKFAESREFKKVSL